MLDRDVVSVVCLNGTSKVTLPALRYYDEGHVIKIKNLSNNPIKVYPSTATYLTYEGETFQDQRMVEREGQTYIDADRGDKFTQQNPYTLQTHGDAMELVFHGEIESSSGKGCWVQYKHPRDW